MVQSSTMQEIGKPLGVTRIGRAEFRWGERTYVMGIINMTPDSFSGDGLGEDVEAAAARARQMVEDGADLIDVGGMSTRPGHTPVSIEEEIRRAALVVARLARELPVPVSIDTYRAEVARRAVEAGAALVNDTWGLRADPTMAEAVARLGVPVVLMHNQHGTEYQDLLPDVIAALQRSIALAVEAGVPEERLIVDPGIGFGKTMEQNLEILNRLSELRQLGRPILLGTSRKSTIGRILDLPPAERVEGTAATVAIGIARGTDIVRVHDVRAMVRVCRVADAIVRRTSPPAPSPTSLERA